MKKILSLLLVLVLAIGLLAGCTPAQDEPTPADEPADTPEATDDPAVDPSLAGTTVKVLLAYGGAENSFEQFTADTGINVEYIEISTGQALAQIQAADGVSAADVWFGGGVDSYISAAELGYLEAYVSPEAATIRDEYKDKDGYWTGLALVPAGFLVNNDVLAEKGLEAPQTWEDLADPAYHDEIIMASPAISGTQYAILNGLLQAMGEEAGWELWEKIDANVTTYAQGGGEPMPKTIAGEYAIGVLATVGSAYQAMEEAPVEVINPTDYIPWTPAPIGLFADAENPEGAKVMIDYFLSQQGQEKLMAADARIMTRPEVAIPDVMETLDASKLIVQDVKLFGSQREAVLARWAELIGDK
ncbi:MAG TPA: ABC transporter substrate-binding protein [Tissierellia bacterium]|nr:ABC transporter substrate-binding protein [Tissierellia bacterium]